MIMSCNGGCSSWSLESGSAWSGVVSFGGIKSFRQHGLGWVGLVGIGLEELDSIGRDRMGDHHHGHGMFMIPD